MSFKVTAKLLKDINSESFRALRTRIKGDDVVVRVGLPEGKTYRKGTTPIAMVGAVHEFGSPDQGIPERPWLRPGIKSGKESFIRLNRINLIKVLRGQMNLQTALSQLGAMAVGFVQKYVRTGTFTPLKPATIKAKGSSQPLIDTGQMVQSVTFELGSREDKE